MGNVRFLDNYLSMCVPNEKPLLFPTIRRPKEPLLCFFFADSSSSTEQCAKGPSYWLLTHAIPFLFTPSREKTPSLPHTFPSLRAVHILLLSLKVDEPISTNRKALWLVNPQLVLSYCSVPSERSKWGRGFLPLHHKTTSDCQ